MDTVGLSVNDCSLTDIQVMSTNSQEDKMNTGIYCEANLYNNKIFSDEGQCLFEGPYTISEQSNPSQIYEGLIDFEALIDSISENNAIATLQDNINEFESVLNNFDTTSVVNIDEDLTYKEIDNFFDSLPTDVDLNTQAIADIPNTTGSVDIEENITQNACNEKPTETSEINDHIQNNNENSQDDTTTQTIAAMSMENNSKDSIDIISISSETSQSADDGYNSSDFEFITEEQATIEGYIINFSRDNISDAKLDESDTKGEIKVTRLNKINSVSKVKNTRQVNSDRSENRSENKYAYLDPGEGPSGINFSDENNSQTKDNNSNIHPGEGSSLKTDHPYRSNHIIPEGEGYLDLFRGPYDPVLPLSDIIFMENKSIRPSAMNTQYEGMGFDQQLMNRRYQPDSSEEEFEGEAEESVKMILSMYPGENRRRRSRRH